MHNAKPYRSSHRARLWTETRRRNRTASLEGPETGGKKGGHPVSVPSDQRTARNLLCEERSRARRVRTLTGWDRKWTDVRRTHSKGTIGMSEKRRIGEEAVPNHQPGIKRKTRNPFCKEGSIVRLARTSSGWERKFGRTQGGAIGLRCEDVRKKAHSKGGRFEPPASNQPTALECLAKEVRLLDLLKHRLDAPFLCATLRVCCQPIVRPFRRSSTLRQPQRIVKGQKKSIGLGRDAYEHQRRPLAIDIDSRKLVRSWRIHRLQMEVPSNEEQNGRAQTAIPTSNTSRT